MGTTDKDALVASQIAYMEIKEKDISDAIRDYGSATLENIFKVKPEIKKQYIERVYNGRDPETTELSEYEQMRLEEAESLLEEVMNSPYAQWEIVAVEDKNEETGFYGCLIDCGEGQAIFGFRGSESYNLEQIYLDWIKADLALLNNPLTQQQKDAREFVTEMNRQYGDRYKVFDFSGHSLGGNLSQHAGVTVPADMREKVGTIYNLDGPGYSHEYLVTHFGEIRKMSSHVKHYQWSGIGNLLNRMPGESFQSIRTDDRVYEIYDVLEGFAGALFQKHDTGFVWRLLLEGNTEFFLPGKMDPFANAAGIISKKIDSIPVVAPLGMSLKPSADLASVYSIAALFILAEESANTEEFINRAAEYYLPFLQHKGDKKVKGVAAVRGIWGEAMGEILAGADFIALWKEPYFRQVNAFKKQAARITVTKGSFTAESRMISFNHMVESYRKLEHLMKLYRAFLLESAESYREAGELMLLKEKAIL